MLYDSIIKNIALLNIVAKRKFIFYALLASLMGLLDSAVISIIIPYLNVIQLNNFENLSGITKIVVQAIQLLGFKDIIFGISVVTAALVLLFGISKIIVGYQINRYIEEIRSKVSTNLFSNFLDSTFETVQQGSKTDLATDIIVNVDQFIHWSIKPLFAILHQITVAALIVFILLITSLESLLALPIFAAMYWLIYTVARKKLKFYGDIKDQLHGKRHRLVSDSSGLFLDLKLRRVEAIYKDKLDGLNEKYANVMRFINNIALVPNNMIEIIAFGSLITLSYYLKIIGNEDFITIIGVFALAAYRIKPAAQQIYQGVANLNFGLSVSNKIYNGIDFKLDKIGLELSGDTNQKKIKLGNNIRLKNISLHRHGSSHHVLKDINIEVKKGGKIGIIGPSGCGKTTLLMIIMGAIQPSHGELLVDETPITDQNTRDWMENIGYVSQNPYLLHDSILKNIILDSDKVIDKKLLNKAMRTAQLEDFVKSLPHGLDTIVGEGGALLSGGQRQRLSVARQLYDNKPILVLDEVSSALDSAMEVKLFRALIENYPRKTLILVSHRPEPLKYCDATVALK